MTLSLIDTHTHFDIEQYDKARADYVYRSLTSGVRHIVLIGLTASRFARMVRVADDVARYSLDGKVLGVHLAMGLHPIYIDEHDDNSLQTLDEYLIRHKNIAIAEIGLDTYLPSLRTDSIFARQKYFFAAQIDLAKHHQLPVILHIRKAHADVLAILRHHRYQATDLGGIAHSFSGGEQEALAFAKMGFRLGITGQVTNPNAKKLHRAIWAVVKKYGVKALVIETDCPDMMPLPCQHLGRVNEPANLPYVLTALSEILSMDKANLATSLWQNTQDALKTSFI